MISAVLGNRDVAPRTRLVASVVMGVLAAAGVWVLTADVLGPLVGWDVAAATYAASTWTTMAGLDAATTAERAIRDDPGQAAVDGILLTASVASLGAVAAVITAGAPHRGVSHDLAAALGAASLLLTWLLIHLVYTARYARLYYSNPERGINFNQEEPPSFADFAYLAFTIGMTYQVSDTDLQQPAIRRTALRHALLSYLFGAVIIAATINLLAGLAR